MLNDLRKYDNLGTPSFFFQLLSTIKSSKSNWTINDFKKLFHNRIIDGNSIFDGGIVLATKIGVLSFEDGFYYISNDFHSHLKTVDEMKLAFVQKLFYAFKADESFQSIFQDKYLSYDTVEQLFQISNSAFGFIFSNFKQLLIDFEVIIPHPNANFSTFLLCRKYKSLFDRTILPIIKRRRVSVKELEESLKQKEIYGEEAEKFVLSFEKNRLGNKNIDWVAEYVVNAGYDIASFNNNEDNEFNRFIEVKSYEGEMPYFYWSRNEINIAKLYKDKYWVYLVNRKEMNDENYIPIMKQNPINSILNNVKWNKDIECYRVELYE